MDAFDRYILTVLSAEIDVRTVATCDGTTPIYSNCDHTGLWTLFEYPPSIAVATQS